MGWYQRHFCVEKDPERIWKGVELSTIWNMCVPSALFFRMASFITSAIVLNHHGCVTVKANFAGDASRISVGNMRRISLGNMRRISVQNMRGNSIIPDMSFRPHLLNDLRSLENNRGMSKVVNMFFSLKRLLIYIWDYVFYGQPPSVFYPTPQHLHFEIEQCNLYNQFK